jgi:glucokinase
MSEVLISVDLGGTNIRAARLDRDLNIQERVQIPTESQLGCETIIERIKSQIREVLPTDGSTVIGIGVSAPGPMNPRTGILVAPPNLGDCYQVPLEAEIRAAFGLPTFLGNDANVACLAEVARGAAQGARDAIFLTISTGIGGGVITDGRMLLGKDGLGAEVGHMVMLVDGARASTLEKEAAGPALARQARARIEAGETSMIREMVEGDLSRITGKTVGDAATAGDVLALSIIQRAGRLIGMGITTLLHLFNPEVITIGGGVSKVGNLLFDPMNEAIRETSLDRAYWEDLRIVPAVLGDNVSIYGAAALVLTRGGIQDIDAMKSEPPKF